MYEKRGDRSEQFCICMRKSKKFDAGRKQKSFRLNCLSLRMLVRRRHAKNSLIKGVTYLKTLISVLEKSTKKVQGVQSTLGKTTKFISLKMKRTLNSKVSYLQKKSLEIGHY